MKMQLSSVSKRQIDFPDRLFRTDDFRKKQQRNGLLTHWDQCLYRPFLQPRLEEKLVLTAKVKKFQLIEKVTPKWKLGNFSFYEFMTFKVQFFIRQNFGVWLFNPSSRSTNSSIPSEIITKPPGVKNSALWTN